MGNGYVEIVVSFYLNYYYYYDTVKSLATCRIWQWHCEIISHL